MGDLASRDLLPPRGERKNALAGSELRELHNLLGNEWKVINEHHLEKEFKFKDFQSALDFTNKVGALAEEADHHPEICIGWGKAKVSIWTHSVGGLTEADFVFAARADDFG